MITDSHPEMRDASMPLTERIEAAIVRITRGDCNMRIPVEATDPDIVLADCKSALAAKDAEIGVLRESLRGIAASLIKYGQHHAICEFMNSRRACTCGFIEATDYASKEHSAALSKSPATNPDTARLDKLPACFHMLRYMSVPTIPTSQWWHLTYAPNNVYSSVREAIDAHQEPTGEKS